jgi:hypothetical protein
MFPVTRTGVTQQHHDFQVRTMRAAEPWIFNPTKVWWFFRTGLLGVDGDACGLWTTFSVWVSLIERKITFAG